MISCKTKKWGNSLGVVIPKEEVKKLKLHEGQTIRLEIVDTESPLKEFFGWDKEKKIRIAIEENRKIFESKHV